MFTSHYEDDFLIRTLGGDLIRRPEVALGELVANAWDAGASTVSLTIPREHGERLIVRDDGCGLTKHQFDQRWMTLGYNRHKNQGAEVEFPPGRTGNRRAYGRNGQGRHGLLCFGESYEVKTTRDGRTSIFRVRVASGEHPFVSDLIHEHDNTGHGTELSVAVERHLPDPDRIREVLSAKFLHDPGFVIHVNEVALPLAEVPGYSGERSLIAVDPESGRTVQLGLTIIDGEAGRSKHQSGVAFWVGGRLVGEPGWSVMGKPIVDGRTRPGRRLTIVVQCDELAGEVSADWTDFRSTPLTDEVARVVTEATLEILRELYAERARETAAEVIGQLSPELETIGRGERAELIELVQTMTTKNPLMAPDTLAATVSSMIDGKKNASVQSLIKRIETLPATDVDGLHRLLDEWTVRDALTVLDEIGRRIKTAEAIEKLMADKTVDELAILHPLVTHARWLFGPEYDSPHYSSNLGLRNAILKIAGVKPPAKAFENPSKRPDLLVLADSSISVVATEDIDIETTMTTCRRVLLVELKRGGFRIGRKEMDQASGYIEDLLASGYLAGVPYIHAFVVGHEIDSRTTKTRKIGSNPENGRVDAQTFANLIGTANLRLFRIRDQVENRYPDSPIDIAELMKSGTEQLEIRTAKRKK